MTTIANVVVSVPHSNAAFVSYKDPIWSLEMDSIAKRSRVNIPQSAVEGLRASPKEKRKSQSSNKNPAHEGPSSKGSPEGSPKSQSRKSQGESKIVAGIPRRLRRALSLHQESRQQKSKVQTPKSPPLPTVQKQSSSIVHETSTNPPNADANPTTAATTKKFSVVHLPNPNSAGPGPSGFFQQRASFQAETGISATPSPLDKHDEGIICSNNDLHSILCEATVVTQKQTADMKRERMKSHRSLSFDSSVFRLPRKSFSDSPPWLAKHSIAASAAATTSQQQQIATTCEVKNVIQIRLTSDESPAASSGETTAVKDEKVSTPKHSKVTWDERSTVDASVLGTAIESYLSERRPSGESCQVETSGQENNVVQETSLCSTLRSLFVK